MQSTDIEVGFIFCPAFYLLLCLLSFITSKMPAKSLGMAHAHYTKCLNYRKSSIYGGGAKGKLKAHPSIFAPI